jgi:DNA-binding winged helix-turn-helix (wHTH) protein
MPAQESGSVVQIGEWIVHPALDCISRGTETQKLEPRAMRLLLCLANSPGEVVSIDRLLTEVWVGVVVGSASVYEAVSQLRKILGDVEAQPTYIATVPRKGYRLIAAVRRGSAGAAAPPAKDAGGKVVLAVSDKSIASKPRANRCNAAPNEAMAWVYRSSCFTPLCPFRSDPRATG